MLSFSPYTIPCPYTLPFTWPLRYFSPNITSIILGSGTSQIDVADEESFTCEQDCNDPEGFSSDSEDEGPEPPRLGQKESDNSKSLQDQNANSGKFLQLVCARGR